MKSELPERLVPTIERATAQAAHTRGLTHTSILLNGLPNADLHRAVLLPFITLTLYHKVFGNAMQSAVGAVKMQDFATR